MKKLEYRYPGVKPFEAIERDRFFGRERDVNDLYDLILLEKLVVLFGKSGHGKSSLLQAGILPKLADEQINETGRYFPLVVRFGAFVEGQSLDPLTNLLRRLDGERIEQQATKFLEGLMPNQSLWYHFKRRQSDESNKSYLLVFDQFEEFFSYPQALQMEFKSQLSELLYQDIPQQIRNAASKLDRASRLLLSEPIDIKVVFVVRSDRISLLDSLKDKLPGILHKRYELKALSKEQALDALVMPAQLPSTTEGEFYSKPFTYAGDSLSLIIDELSKDARGGQTGGVEAFQLQILAQYIEGKVIRGEILDRDQNGTPDVFPEDLPNLGNIYAEYYNNKILELPEIQRLAAHRLIEDGLVFAGERGEARRLSMDGEVLQQQYSVSRALLDDLENAFLLRREPNALGGYNYELSHDTLINPVLQARSERQLRNQKLKNTRRLKALAGLIFGLLAIVFGLAALTIWALKQAQIAGEQTVLATENSTLATSKTHEAEQNLQIAKENEEKARLAYVQAQLNEYIAEEEKAKAQKNYIDARLARERAELTLAELEKARLLVAHRIFREARDLIYRLQYSQALDKIKEFQKLAETGQKTNLLLDFKVFQQWQQISMEVIYFKNESGRVDEARKALIDAVDFIGQNMDLTKELNTMSNLDIEVQRQKIDTILRRFDSHWFSTLNKRYYPEMVFIQGGDFFMGCDSSTVAHCEPIEYPPHMVKLSSYKMAKYETTVWQFALFCASTGRKIFKKPSPSFGLDGDNPIVYFNWYDAISYSNWLSTKFGNDSTYVFGESSQRTDKEGYVLTNYVIKIQHDIKGGYRLPTEAEWEFAARGGVFQDTFKYSGGNNLPELGWYWENSDTNGIPRPHSVGLKKSNRLGLYDMSGNAMEWCQDWFAPYEYPATTTLNPKGPENGTRRVIRGGGWIQKGHVTKRYNNRSPDGSTTQIGFRVIQTLE